MGGKTAITFLFSLVFLFFIPTFILRWAVMKRTCLSVNEIYRLLIWVMSKLSCHHSHHSM